jgi:iron complex outermembrane recepter protein
MYKMRWAPCAAMSGALLLGAPSFSVAQKSGDADFLDDTFLELIGSAPADAEPTRTPGGAGEDQPASGSGANDQQSSQPSKEAVPYPDSIPVAETLPESESLAQRMFRPGREIEEIIVTAQRREENIQDVAISITVLDQEQISKADMTTSADIARYTPSLSANTRFGTDNATFTIRGFTQDLRTTASVGTYFAEVVAPRGQSTQTSGDGAGPGTLFDLQNIQVLKGPQGTLFGRNTTGGAILIVPQKPTGEFEGYAEFTGAQMGGLRGQGVCGCASASTTTGATGC